MPPRRRGGRSPGPSLRPAGMMFVSSFVTAFRFLNPSSGFLSRPSPAYFVTPCVSLRITLCSVAGKLQETSEGGPGMKIRTLIVDDEPLAREWVRNGLQDEPDLESSASAATASRPSRRSPPTSPTWFCSTSRCPGLDGFGVLASVEPRGPSRGHLRDGVRPLCAEGIRGARGGLPDEALLERASPRGRRARPRRDRPQLLEEPQGRRSTRSSRTSSANGRFPSGCSSRKTTAASSCGSRTSTGSSPRATTCGFTSARTSTCSTRRRSGIESKLDPQVTSSASTARRSSTSRGSRRCTRGSTATTP